MTITVEAIYEGGKLVLPRPLSLPEKAHVRVTIEAGEMEREALLKLSEDSLSKTWSCDEGFNELKAMAGDPQIQRELHSINAGFAAAESDGLDKI